MSCAPASRPWHAHRCTPTRSTRPSRCRPILGTPHRPQHPAHACQRNRARPAASIPGAAASMWSALPTTSLSRALAHIEEVEKIGGMAKAIEAGIPKRMIEQAATATQGRRLAQADHCRRERIIRPSSEADIAILKVDNPVGQAQDKLARLKAERNSVREALDALTRNADRRRQSARRRRRLRAKATVGEISTHWRRCMAATGRKFQRSPGPTGRRWVTWSGSFNRVEIIDGFETEHGRRPRILVAKMGQDGHDRGQKVIAVPPSPISVSTWISAPFPNARGSRPPGGRERRALSSACRRSRPAI